MIQEYHRPGSLEEALDLLTRITPRTIPLGGGSGISRSKFEVPIAVVDLQKLNLGILEKQGGRIIIGSTAKLKSITEWTDAPPFLKNAISKDANENIKNAGTIGGSIIRINGKSRIGIVLLAADCQLVWEPGTVETSLGNWLATERNNKKLKLLTGLFVDLPKIVNIEEVTQTPRSFPLVSVCLAQWSSGRTRLVLSEAGSIPICVFDGKSTEGLENSIIACSHFSNNKYSTKTYQKEITQILVKRIINRGL